ncbi:MAG: phosphoribosyl-ATP diphosphatase [Deltaproteobacteria bacterium]|nr:phosphoribosyl-ATP diphosphatase [Deltaproteobacteria bacterium]
MSDDGSGSIIDRLYAVICERRDNPRLDSYVSSLLQKGRDQILKKVGEESCEVLLAAKNRDDAALIHEIADLTFHLLVLIADHKIPPGAIAFELERRFGTSGLTEKATRKA